MFITNFDEDHRPLTALPNDAELAEGLIVIGQPVPAPGRTGDVLDFSKIEAGKMQLRSHPCELEQTAFDVMHTLSARAAEKGLELILHYGEACRCSVETDAGRLDQILYNLIDNAIKFTERGHVVLVIHCTEQLAIVHMQVETLAEPEQALDLLARGSAAGRAFDIVLLDHMMPGMDGEALGRAILATGSKAAIPPLILLTSSGQRCDAKHFKDIGFSAYLTKPVLRRTLRKTLISVLGTRAAAGSHMPAAPVPERDPSRRTIAGAAPLSTPRPALIGHILLVEDNHSYRRVALAMLRRFAITVDVAADGR